MPSTSESDLTGELEALRARVAELERSEAKRQQVLASHQQELRLLKQAIAHSPIVVWSIDADGIFTYSEGQGLESLGLRPGEVDGTSAFQMYQDEPLVIDHLRRVLSGEEFCDHVSVSDVVFDSWYAPIYDEAGAVNGAVGVATNITRQAREKERRVIAEARCRTLVEQLPAITYEVEAREPYRTRFISPQIEQILGFTAEEWIQDVDAWSRQLDPLDRERTLCGRFLSSSELDPHEAEYRLLTRDGRPVWFHDRSVLVRDNPDGVPCIRGVMLDITDRKAAELRSLEIEELNRGMLEAMPGGIVRVDLEGKIQSANPEAVRLMKISREALETTCTKDYEGRCFREDGSDFPWTDFPVTRCLKTGQPHLNETIGVLRPNGKVEWAIYSAVPLRHPQTDAIQGAVVTFLDITELKKVERQLRASEEKYRGLFNSSRDGIAFVNMEGRVIDANPAFLRLLGRSLEELQTMTYEEFTPPEWRTVDEQIVREQVFQRGYSDPYTKEYIRADGTTFPISISVWMLTDGDQPVGMWGIVRDITEEKRAALALARSEEQFRQIVENASDGILMTDRSGSIAFANPRCEELLGYTPEALLGRHFREVIAPEDLPVVQDRFERRMRGDEVENRYEVGLLRRGRFFWGDVNASVILRDGEARGTLVFLRDITTRRNNEIEIRHFSDCEKLVTTISTRFINLPLNGIEKGFDQALEIVGGFAVVDRCCIIQIDAANDTVTSFRQWCATGIKPHANHEQLLELTRLPWFAKGLDNDRVSLISNVDELPPQAQEVREHLELHGIQSVLVVPMWLSGTRIGYVGFDLLSRPREWKSHMLWLLQIVGEIFANAIGRRRAEEELKSSEERFRRLVDHATDAFFVHDLEGNIHDLNEQAAVSLRYTREELLKMKLFNLGPEILPDTFQNLWTQLLPGTPVTYDAEFRRKDGTRFPVEVHAGLFDHGDRQLIIALAHDVSERKRAEAALRAAKDELEVRVLERTAELRTANEDLEKQILERKAAEARWKSVVQNAPDFIMTHDEQGQILFINRTNPNISEEMVLGKSIFEYALPEFHKGLREGLRLAFEKGESHHFEAQAVRSNGEVSWFEGRMGPVKQDGRVTSAITITSDVTARKQAEELAQQHQKELAHVARLSTLGEMAAELAHELNQPLAAIANYANGSTRRLQSIPEYDFSKVFSALEEIGKQSTRASEIIRRMREFVRKREVKHHQLDVRVLIQDVMGLAALEAKKHEVQIHVSVHDDVTCVAVDTIQIEQVLLNLSLNGIEAMVNSPQPRDLRIDVKRSTVDMVEFRVSDNGCGLEPAMEETMFNPFVTTKQQGLGMGLSISRSIVESHGGKLWAMSKPDRGACFHFTLPAHSGESKDDLDTAHG